MDWLSSKEWTTHIGGAAEWSVSVNQWQEKGQGVRTEIQMAASEF